MTNPSEDLPATTEGDADRDADRRDIQSEATPAPPVDTGTNGPRGPGQQLEAGEG